MKLSLLCLIVLAAIFGSCKKENNRKLLNAYFKYEINGVETNIKDEILLKENTFDCILTGDSSLYIHVTKVYEGAGFIIRSKTALKDGYVILDDYNKGFYENPKDKRIYYTNSTYKGSLTFAKDTFQGKSLMNTLRGNFEFEATDVSTGKKFKIEKGEFLMERTDK